MIGIGPRRRTYTESGESITCLTGNLQTPDPLCGTHYILVTARGVGHVKRAIPVQESPIPRQRLVEGGIAAGRPPTLSEAVLLSRPSRLSAHHVMVPEDAAPCRMGPREAPADFDHGDAKAPEGFGGWVGPAWRRDVELSRDVGRAKGV